MLGGVYVEDTANVSGCDITLKDNSAYAVGVRNKGQVTLTNCDIKAESDTFRCGLENDESQIATITNCLLTVSGTGTGGSIVNKGTCYVDGVEQEKSQ